MREHGGGSCGRWLLAAHVQLLALTWVAKNAHLYHYCTAWGHMTQLTVAVDVLPLLSVHLHGVGLKVTALSTARHLEGVREREPPLNRTEVTAKLCL